MHTITEAIKLAFADRDAFYGDPGFVDVPLDQLLSDAYNDERRKLIKDTASMDLRHGTIENYGCTVDYEAAVGRASGKGVPQGGRRPAGEPVGALGPAAESPATSTLSTRMGIWLPACRPAASVFTNDPALGFQLNSRAQMFWLDKGEPMSLGRASGRAPHCRRRWHCATASHTSLSGRQAAISRINGKASSSCVMRSMA